MWTRMYRKELGVQFITMHRLCKAYLTPSGDFLALNCVDLQFRAGTRRHRRQVGEWKVDLAEPDRRHRSPEFGEISIGETALRALSESQLCAFRGRNVGVVFQFFQLLPTLTILENVLLPMDFCGTFAGSAARERALHLLEQVGIGEQADKLPAALSGGQQQRAAIARALANDPPLIVADEPTGNLDSHTAGAVIELLRGLTERGKTVLMVTHEREVAGVVDRVVTLVDGRVSSPNANLRAAEGSRA